MITSRKGLWKGGPFKALTEGLSKSGGRNAQGGITVRHRGGGHKKVYRQVRHGSGAEVQGGAVLVDGW